MFKSLFSKIMSSYILIPTLILLALFIFLPYNLESYLAAQKKEELVENGKEISEIISSEERININRILSSFAQSLGTNLILVSQEGVIINNSRGVARILEGPNRLMRPGSHHRGMMHNSSMMREPRQNNDANSSTRDQFKDIFGLEEELKKVLAGKTITFRGASNTLDTSIIAVGIPVNNSSPKALFLISPLHDFKNAIDNIRMLTIQVVAVAILLALLLGYFISKGITEPIARMKGKVKQITNGNFSTQIDNLPDDELGELGESFNYMSNKLEENLTELAKEKNRMQEMLTSMTEGVLGIRADGKIMLTNNVIKDILAINSDLTEEDFAERLPPELVELIEKVLAAETEEEIEFEINEQVLTAQAAPVKRPDDKLWGIIILVSDITEIKRLEEMRRLFVANVSHELKTPLTSIQGYLEAILDGMITDKEEEEEYIKRVLNETDRMSNLVGEVLDLAKLQSEQFEFQLETVNLKAVIKSVYNDLESRFAHREVKLDVADDLDVKADPDKLKEVLINLISNAIKFTAENGKIELESKVTGGKVTLNVIDDGVGIPKSELSHIWERFHQVDRSRKPDREGTGLGLAIVKEMVEGMKGEVEVESTVGEGSKFSFSLDIATKGVSKDDKKIR